MKKYLYYGAVGGVGIAFYDKSYLSGVAKNKGTDLAHPIKFETENKEKLQASMKMAREDMAMLAEELSKLLD